MLSEIVFTGPDGFRTYVKQVRLYSDTTPMIKLPDFEEIVERADTLILRPKGLQGFVEAMFLVDAIQMKDGNIENLILPYIPGARQDRTNVSGDVLFTAWSVCDMVNQRGFDQVLVLDPHSNVVTDLLNNVVEYPLENVARRMWGGYTGVIAADRGGKRRAERVASALSLPIFYGEKHRDVATGKLSGFSVEVLPQGGHFLVVDDICDGGGTFLGLGEQIAAQGCFADLFVTHGIFSKGSADLRKIFKSVYTTDSRYVHDRHVLTIPVMEDMEAYL